MKRQTYTPEIKERAVRMLIEAAGDYPSTWAAIQAIAPKIGCTPETLRSWHKKHIDQTMNRPEIVGDSTLQENTTMKTRNYTPEMKERAVRMLVEAKDDYPSTWSAIKAIAPKIGCTPETLRSWHKKHIDKTIPAKIQAQSQAERIKDA